MTKASLVLTRAQILAHRRKAGVLDERLPLTARSLRRAAWAGLQDSVPRSALHALHARIAGTTGSTWEHPALVQLWGPRFTVHVVPAEDRAIFSLSRLPDTAKARHRAEDLAARLHTVLGRRRQMTYGEVGRVLGINPNLLRYAAQTGRVLIRWEGARLSTVWIVRAPEISPRDARLELARRYLHVLGPSTPAAFARWAGLSRATAPAVFDALALVPVRTPVGDAWILSSDEPSFRAATGLPATARLLPSGDPYLVLHGADRALLVPEPSRRDELWTPRVWPGAVLVDGEIVGTWRRDGTLIVMTPWRRLAPAEREAVEAEARSLPLPGVGGSIRIQWRKS